MVILEQKEQTDKIASLARKHLSANVRSFDNTVIFDEGSDEKSGFLILHGCVSIYSGDTQLACRREGELIGEQVLFQQKGKRTASAKALGHVELLEFAQSDIQKLSPCQQLVFWEWYSKTLSQKLEQATLGRVDIDGLRARDEGLLKKFVPYSGIDAARIALLEDKNLDSFYKSARAIIWFSDLTGFSVATSDKEPSEIAAMISTLLGQQIKLIQESKGEIDKLMGDGLMAFWLLSKDDNVSDLVESSIKSALKINKKISQLADRHGWSVGIRIGMHIGDVAVGSFGTKDRFSYTILGKDVNSASRYEQAQDKKLGNVRISPEMFGELPKNSSTRRCFSSNTRSFEIKGHIFDTHVLKENN